MAFNVTFNYISQGGYICIKGLGKEHKVCKLIIFLNISLYICIQVTLKIYLFLFNRGCRDSLVVKKS
jgi:hypothetical protein